MASHFISPLIFHVAINFPPPKKTEQLNYLGLKLKLKGGDITLSHHNF